MRRKLNEDMINPNVFAAITNYSLNESWEDEEVEDEEDIEEACKDKCKDGNCGKGKKSVKECGSKKITEDDDWDDEEEDNWTEKSYWENRGVKIVNRLRPDAPNIVVTSDVADEGDPAYDFKSVNRRGNTCWVKFGDMEDGTVMYRGAYLNMITINPNTMKLGESYPSDGGFIDYLCGLDDGESVKVKAVIEKWISKDPEEKLYELESRLKSYDDDYDESLEEAKSKRSSKDGNPLAKLIKANPELDDILD